MALSEPDPSDAKRDEVLSLALELIALIGYTPATTAQLAKAASLGESELISLFGSRDALFGEVLRRRDELDTEQFVGELGPTITDFGAAIEGLVRQNSRVPGLVQLFTGVIAEATPVEHASHRFLAARYRNANSALTAALDDIAAQKLARADLPASMVSVLTSALIDGLQTQWLYDRNLDMGAHIRLFWKLVEQAYGTQQATGVEAAAVPDSEPGSGPRSEPE